MERELRRLRRNELRNRKLLLRTQAALDSLLRAAYLDPETIPFPHRLTARRFGVYSQNGEDGLLVALLREIGTVPSRSFAEIGAGTNGGNAGFLARELGWKGLMIDASAANVEELRLRFGEGRVRIVRTFVTRENVNDLLASGDVGPEPGVLSIDIDGNDIWVWEAVDARPAIAIIEYNPLFGPARSVAVPYDEQHAYTSESFYYGASLAAITTMSARKGYRLVAVEPRGVNAFFLREDIAPSIPETSPEDAFVTLLSPSELYADPMGPERAARLRAREGELDREIREGALPLVELG